MIPTVSFFLTVCSCVLVLPVFIERNDGEEEPPEIEAPTETGAQSNAIITQSSPPSAAEQQRGVVERDDGEEETRIRVRPTESTLESDFVAGLDGWIFNGLNVIVLDCATLENGSEFSLIQYKFTATTIIGNSQPMFRTVSGWLCSKYVRLLWS